MCAVMLWIMTRTKPRSLDRYYIYPTNVSVLVRGLVKPIALRFISILSSNVSCYIQAEVEKSCNYVTNMSRLVYLLEGHSCNCGQ